MADAKLLNLAKIQARLAKIPTAAAEALDRQLKVEVDDLAEAQRRAMDAIYETHSHDHEALRDSVHAYKNPDRAISYRVIADARDADGAFIGSHVEAGHKGRDGKHVAGRPAFYPTYRARKSGMKRRVSAAARKAVRAAYPEGT